MTTVRLYVSNLPWATNDADLTAFFAPSKVGNIKIPTGRDTGRPRGFAFVDVEGDAQALIAQFNNMPMGGRAIRVSIANEKHPKKRAGDTTYGW
jgi:RNA recognition motif-containing protein